MDNWPVEFRMRTAILGALFCIVFLFLPSLLYGQADSIAQISSKLQAIKVVEDPAVDIPYDVPAEVRPLLKELKHELRDLVTNTLNEGEESATPRMVRESLIRKLNLSNVKLKPVVTGPTSSADEDLDKYGLIENIRIERPKGQSDLLAAVVTLQIPCGEDSSLYIFENRGNNWRLALAHEANDYEQVKGAMGDYKYSISRFRDSGSWYVAESWSDPWCTSVWRSINYRAIRPGMTSEDPNILFHGESGINISYKTTLQASENSFRVSFATMQTLDIDLWVRKEIAIYDLSHSPIRRIGPLGEKPEDFLDVWLRLPSTEAVRWIAGPSPDKVLEWHERLNRSITTASIPSIDFVQPCSTHPSNVWQIGLAIDNGAGVNGIPSTLFFTVGSHGSNRYYLTRIDTTRPPGCPGQTRPTRDTPDIEEN